MITKHVVLVVPVALVLAVACSSSSDDSAQNTPASDASTTPEGSTNDGALVDANADTFVPLTEAGACELTTQDSNGLDFGPVEVGNYSPNYLKGVAVEAVPCGVVTAKDDGTGHITVPHPGVPFYYKLTKATYLPTLTMEHLAPLNMGGTFAQKGLLLVPEAAAATHLPGYDATKANLILRVAQGTAACQGNYTVTLDGHPEAQVTYWTNDPASGGHADALLTKMPAGSVGFLSISKINPAGLANLTLTVTNGCSLTVSYGGIPTTASGKVLFEAGSVTYGNVGG
jgi:hypothetical protein